MVQSLIQRIRENKLDALYLFINESLRDRNEFDVFFHNLMVVLPNNWSINRVEIGHEFLSRTVVDNQQQEGQAEGRNNNENNEGQIINESSSNDSESKQDQLFRWVCSLESLRSLIISDGYIPRKDHGFVDTKALLRHLPRANNLQYLDIQRLKLRITGDSIENNDAELLAESLDSLRDSLEDLRLTAISLWDTTIPPVQDTNNTTAMEQKPSASNRFECNLEQPSRRYPLDATIRVCGEMANLQLLAISCDNGCECQNDDGEDHEDSIRDGESETDGNSSLSSNNKLLSTKRCLISREVLLQLCRSSSTLQELALRSMRIDDDMCKTIAKAFDPAGNNKTSAKYLTSSSTSSLSLLCSESDQDNDDESEGDATDANDTVNNHSPSFWTSLDLRRNPSIGTEGYEAILSSLERNYDLWCSLMVDNDSFQSRFNALIELNQANRGALVRSPTPEKLAVFLDRLKDDPTALWYFLTIHRDSILHPLIRYLKWKNVIHKKKREGASTPRTNVENPAIWREQQYQLFQGHEQNQRFTQKRSAEVAALPFAAFFQPTALNNTTAPFPSGDGINTKETDQNQKDEVSGQSQELNIKRQRQSTEGIEVLR